MILEYFFIIFAPGTAGNHVANLISTSPRFTARVDEYFYDNLVGNAHPITKTETNFEPAQSVACYHLGQYLWVQDQVNATRGNKRFLLIEFSAGSRTELFTNRILSLYPYYSNCYLMEELSTVYSVNIFEKLTGEHDVTPLPADLIFNTDSTNLVQYLNQNFDLTLDPAVVQRMHTRWITMIQQLPVDQ